MSFGLWVVVIIVTLSILGIATYMAEIAGHIKAMRKMLEGDKKDGKG